MHTLAQLSTADLLILSTSEIDEAAAAYREEQDKAAAQDTFALYEVREGQMVTVKIEEFQGEQVLVSDEDGGEFWVSASSLEYLD